MEHIRQELRYSRKLFAERGWPAIDVSGKAVEETAREVLNLVDLRVESQDGDRVGPGDQGPRGQC